MPAKITIDLSQIDVESFEVQPAEAPEGGTVQGHDDGTAVVGSCFNCGYSDVRPYCY